MGKCLLAWDRDPEQAVGRLTRLSPLTPHTITDPDRLVAELDAVRRQGWAVNNEERIAGVRTVAVPVFGPGEVAVAAIAVQGPATRVTPDRDGELAAELQDAAGRVGRIVGALAMAE